MSLNSYKNLEEYPDRYFRNKNWKKVLPVASRPLQVAELIEMQSIIQDNVKQGFDTLFKNGSAISGLRISILKKELGINIVSVSEGQIYLEGQILDVPLQQLNIPTTGVFNIYVEVTEEIVTYEQDPTLRDPIKGIYVLGTPGASRLVWNTSIGFSQENVFKNNTYIIGQINEGIIKQADINLFYKIDQIISKFIYEKNGNFCVEGFDVSSIGLDKRSASNINTYELLESRVSSAENERQQALSNATAYQQIVSNLNNKIQETQLQNVINPNISNTNLLNSLQNQLREAQDQFNGFSNELINAQNNLEKARKDFRNSESIITDQQIVSISSGIAYIEGHRVVLNSPTSVYIPISLPTTLVESATFTYRGITNQLIRTLNFETGNTIIQNSNQYTTFEIEIKNIYKNNNILPAILEEKFDIKIVYKLTNTSLSLTNLINIIIFDINNYNSTNSNLTYTLFNEEKEEIITNINNVILSQEEKKQIINAYVNLKNGAIDNALIIEAKNNLYKAEEVLVNTFSKLYDNEDNLISNFSNILIDVDSSTFAPSINTGQYQLGFRPVVKINRLVGRLEATQVLIRSEQGFTDRLADDTIVEILEITQTIAGTTTTFTPSSYSLENQSSVLWRPNTPQPNTGTSYVIKYIYTEPLIENSDFRLNKQTDNIEFIGRTPRINDIFTVDYVYSLSKAGVITLNKDGVLGFLLSNAAKEPVVPNVPNTLLSLASFVINTQEIKITKLECRRLTVEDLYNLSEKVKQNTINNEILKTDLDTLNTAVIQGFNPIGVFSDTFINLNKLDIVNTSASILPGLKSFINNYRYTEIPVTYDSNNTSAFITINEFNLKDYACLPYTEIPFYEQKRATKTRNVVKLDTSLNGRARMFISTPLLFNNKYKTTLDLQQSFLNISPCDPISRQGFLLNITNSLNLNNPELKSIYEYIKNSLGEYGSKVINSFEKARPLLLSNTNVDYDYMELTYNNVVLDNISLEIIVEGLLPNTPGYKLYLNGNEYFNYDFRGGTSSSLVTNNNTIIGMNGITTDSKGKLELKINLPSDLPTGTHYLEVYKEGKGYATNIFRAFNNILNQTILSPLYSWSAYPISTNATLDIPLIEEDLLSEDLFSLGIDTSLDISTIDNTVTYSNDPKSNYTNKHNSINQTFVVSNNYFLTSIELKINNIGTGINNKLGVYLSNTINDVPSKDTIAQAYANTYVITQINKEEEGQYTKFEFNTPKILNKGNKYNIGLESNVTNEEAFSIYSAIADELDLNTESIIGNQLFIEGDLFTSKDGSSLYLESKEDLTMKLNRAEFITSAVIDLGLYTTINLINYFCLNTRNIIPVGTNISYEYTITNSNIWKPFNANIVTCLETNASSIEIRATLSTNFTNVSPLMLLNGSTVSLYSANNTSQIISKQIIYPEPYIKAFVQLDYIKPSNTNIKIFISDTNKESWEGNEWKELTIVPNSTIIKDTLINLYSSTYSIIFDNINYAFEFPRTKFRYKIELYGDNIGNSPLIKNVRTYVE